MDSAKVIERSLDYIFETNSFLPTYYSQPVKLIKSDNVPKTTSFRINGKACELVDKPEYQDFFKDTSHPVPYVEVEELKFKNKDSVHVNILFRATGHLFMLTLERDEKSNWKVVKMEEETI